MDRRYADIIEKSLDLAALSLNLLRNAMHDKEIETYTTPRLHDLSVMLGQARQQLLYEVHSQTSKEPWDKELPQDA